METSCFIQKKHKTNASLVRKSGHGPVLSWCYHCVTGIKSEGCQIRFTPKNMTILVTVDGCEVTPKDPNTAARSKYWQG